MSSRCESFSGKITLSAELIWTFVSEADPSSGQVNCAVEPPRTNALARVLFQNNC